MFSLLVSNFDADKATITVKLERSRFLEYTDTQVAAQLTSLSAEAIDCLKAWPCILMREGRAGETFILSEIVNILEGPGTLTFSLRLNPLLGSIPGHEWINSNLWPLRTDLGIEDLEFSRTHFSVKTPGSLGRVEAVRDLDDHRQDRRLPGHAPSCTESFGADFQRQYPEIVESPGYRCVRHQGRSRSVIGGTGVRKQTKQGPDHTEIRPGQSWSKDRRELIV